MSRPHPVVLKILERLGIEPPAPPQAPKPEPEPVPQNKPYGGSADLTIIEKMKLAWDAENPRQKKQPKTKKTKPEPTSKNSQKKTTPRKSAAQALAAFYQQPGRKPIWVTQKGLRGKTSTIIKGELRHADAYGLRPRDFAIAIPLAKNGIMTTGQLADFELKMSKTVLRYVRYAKGGRIDPRKLSRFQDRSATLPDLEKVLGTLAKTDNPGTVLRSFHPQHPQFKALRQKLITLSSSKLSSKPGKKTKATSEKLRARLLLNMERWRWLPGKMQGENNIFVWANVPELRIRIIREGKVIFTEKVIAGKRGKQSPMFSDKMEWIEFNPTWFIPNSIKVADILPSLRRKGRVMSKYHLRLDCGKFGSDFSSIDWSKVDIRKCAVTQPAGVKSVLGKLKFKFPNKHAVYMHDTLTPGLFKRKHRILSHGCIRVRNPRRMAEVLLAHDKGMSNTQVGTLLAGRSLRTVHLSRSIPVHITYFSTRVEKNGSLTHHPDYYGHDKRLAQALLGKGHLFKGAIYSGTRRYKRKRRPRPSQDNPILPQYMRDQ